LPGRAEDVLLTGQVDAVVADVLGAAGRLEAAEAAGLGERLRARAGKRGARADDVEQTRAAVDNALEVASGFIRERPILCLAGALAIGYVVGKIVSR